MSTDDEKALKDEVAGFYAALDAVFLGDAGPMRAVWSHADDVTYMGPDGGFEVGWNEVGAMWDKQAASKLGGKVSPSDMRINVGHYLPSPIISRRARTPIPVRGW
jgi:hypothetical protein